MQQYIIKQLATRGRRTITPARTDEFQLCDIALSVPKTTAARVHRSPAFADQLPPCPGMPAAS